MTDPRSDRWKHQESSSEDEATASTSRNGNFVNGPPSQRDYQAADGTLQSQNTNGYGPGGALQVLCGPLLNYQSTHMTKDRHIWRGTVLVVAEPGNVQPTLEIQRQGSSSQYAHERTQQSFRSQGQKLYEDATKTFWRFQIDVNVENIETSWQYRINAGKPTSMAYSQPRVFVVPGKDQSMRIMFHSCNGFSVGTDEEAWSGPALWNDVLRVHEKKPFHVMIGGGDQIYNDSVRVNGPLRTWTDIGNPQRRRAYPFDAQMRDDCDQFYFDNYTRWYSTGAFATANAQIPQLNMWDDHDIIDGFGSYTDHFMRCAVFRGIGSVAFKYYCLFQHHIPPQAETYTTSTPTPSTQGKEAFVLKEELSSNFIVGQTPGPYISLPSHSLFTTLGARIAFLAIDARTERTRHQVNYPETYKLIINRVNHGLESNRQLNHLIVLLGVPIAYPRLAWLENVFKSPIIGPIRFLNKRFGIAGGLFNNFDGNVDLLDDLDDHYTARQHKRERKELMLQLQILAAKHSVRVTILGGDVHLAALGKFYSGPKSESGRLPEEKDPRHMVNIISSAITNKPPPKPVANLLARRNKIHHLDHHTDETLIDLFKDDDVDDSEVKRLLSEKRANVNHLTMPSRNFAIIEEQSDSTMTTARSLECSFRVEIDQHDREGRTYEYPFKIPGLQLGAGEERRKFIASAEKSIQGSHLHRGHAVKKEQGNRP